jgi:tetratricopeptide (TPR) repeat protein
MDWEEFPINQFRAKHDISSPLERPSSLNTTKDTEQYMTLVNTKPYFLLKASQLCKYETYVWIDFGILKLTSDLEHVSANLRQLKRYSKILIPGGFDTKGLLSESQLMKHIHWRFLGGIVVCPAQYIQPFFTYTFEELSQLVLKRKITWEINIWNNVESRHPYLIQYMNADCNPKIFGFYDQKIILIHKLSEPIVDISGFQTWVYNVVTKNKFHAVCFIVKTGTIHPILYEIVKMLRVSFIPVGITDDANTFREELGWDTESTYGCRLDSTHMSLQIPNGLPRLTKAAYTVTHAAQDNESAVVTFQRLDGTTQTDFDTSSEVAYISKSVCVVNTSTPYVSPAFTVAQSHCNAGRWKEAIHYFKQSIRQDSLSSDEKWYAHYRIAQAWRLLGDDIKMEAWVNRAYQYKKTRAEPLYLACSVFRERRQPLKAYHYYKLGKAIARPNDADAYYVEPSVYTYKFDFENTILHYWIFSSKSDRIKGLIDIIRYLNKTEYQANNVLMNMDYYIPRLANVGITSPLTCCQETPDRFAPSSASIVEWNGRHVVNVRYVNYRIQPNGGYMMYDNGTYNAYNNLQTRNAIMYLDMDMDMDMETPHPVFFDPELDDLPKLDCGIRGIEDVRLFVFQNKLMYTATTREYSYKQDTNRIIIGTYDTECMKFRNNRILRPPTETVCEKNWIPINHRDETIYFVYGWHPLQIGSIAENNQLIIHIRHNTPPFWKHYRGSSTFLSHTNQLWCITHGVKEGSPRRYYHQFVALDATTYAPLQYSVPFFFMDYKIEYCVGFYKKDETFVCLFSRNDKDPYILQIRTAAIESYMMSVSA